jgi:hypothetical protein
MLPAFESFFRRGSWVLGNENIDEVTEYKYLGHFINRSMKSNYHINTYLKSKSENQMNYLMLPAFESFFRRG